MKFQTGFNIFLVLLILVVGIKVTWDWRSDVKAEKKQEIMREGAEQGLAEIVDIVARCNRLPVNINNITTTLVSLECVQNELDQIQFQPQQQQPMMSSVQ